MEEWWLHTRGLVPRGDRRKFDTLVIATSWLIWKQRNARVFGNRRELCDVLDLVDRIHDEFMIWLSARAGGREGE
jgi:hypothetical protein